MRESATDFFHTLHFTRIPSPNGPLALTTNADRSAKKYTETQKYSILTKNYQSTSKKSGASRCCLDRFQVDFRTKAKNRYLNPKLNPKKISKLRAFESSKYVGMFFQKLKAA